MTTSYVTFEEFVKAAELVLDKRKLNKFNTNQLDAKVAAAKHQPIYSNEETGSEITVGGGSGGGAGEELSQSYYSNSASSSSSPSSSSSVSSAQLKSNTTTITNANTNINNNNNNNNNINMQSSDEFAPPTLSSMSSMSSSSQTAVKTEAAKLIDKTNFYIRSPSSKIVNGTYYSAFHPPFSAQQKQPSSHQTSVK